MPLARVMGQVRSSDDPSSARWLSEDERADLAEILSRNAPEAHHFALRDGFFSEWNRCRQFDRPIGRLCGTVPYRQIA